MRKFKSALTNFTLKVLASAAFFFVRRESMFPLILWNRFDGDDRKEVKLVIQHHDKISLNDLVEACGDQIRNFSKETLANLDKIKIEAIEREAEASTLTLSYENRIKEGSK